jgi:hypothetical protein
MSNKIQILIRDEAEFRQRNDIAIHLLNPTLHELLDAVNTAERDLFQWIVIYVPSKRRSSLHNIFASQSLWNKLRRCLGDVRFGEVGDNWGRSFVSKGEGFTIYMQ